MANGFSDFLDLTKVSEALGDDTPDLKPGAVGRFRLVQALSNRYGNNFKQVKSARRALKDFDDQTDRVREMVIVKEKLGGRKQ
jgi:Fe-S-cluster formation regulator IscX/YfhJ